MKGLQKGNTMATADSRQLREPVRFDPNVPQTVTIESTGTAQPGRDGPEFRYMLEGGKIMWVAEEAHKQIERAKRTDPQGDTFTITKRKSGRAAATWEVVQHADEPQPAPAPRPAPAAALAPPRQAQLPAQGEPYSTTLYTCLCAAMRDAQAAEAFAAQIGRPVAFETADVRAMAATLFIHATGGR
jgi:hypothetical protein